ncbi:MAG TPA: hypothetical protein VN151_12960 [Terracidiphilus sp.]|nr:hypothetical protein [Terracidiphilus sp.]
MRALIAATLLAGSALLTAQTETHASPLGYSYAIPADWQVMDMSATAPAAKQQAQQNATDEMEKRGAGCVNLSLTAQHGAPASVVVIVELPFDCLGQTATEKDLPGFGMGASEGMKQNFDLADPVFGTYTLGTHAMWVERAQGSPKGHSEMSYTVEIACSLLKKAAVCWMAMAADPEALKVFESSAVKLEDDPATALVPATAFEKKPSQ